MRDASFRQDQLIVLFGVATVVPVPGSAHSTEFQAAEAASSEVTRGIPSPRHLEPRPQKTRLRF